MIKDKYQITSLKERPDLYKDTVALIEESFHYQNNQFEVDFAPLISIENHKQCHLLIEENKVIGHIGVKRRDFGLNPYSSPVALIGGIAIDKDYRGKGLFTLLFNNIIETYSNGVAFFILWSDLNNLYKKYNFHQAGVQVQYGQNTFDENILSKKFTKTKFKEISSTDLIQLKEIYKKEIEDKYATLIRTEKDWKLIERINSTDIFLYKDQGKLKGYFFVHKGQDLFNIIHESSCLDSHHNTFYNDLKKFKLWSPDKYLVQTDDMLVLYTAIFKIGNLGLFNKFLNIWSSGEVSITNLKDNQVFFKYKSIDYDVNISDFFTYLFGPSKIKEFENYSRPIFISGLDSI